MQNLFVQVNAKKDADFIRCPTMRHFVSDLKYDPSTGGKHTFFWLSSSIRLARLKGSTHITKLEYDTPPEAFTVTPLEGCLSGRGIKRFGGAFVISGKCLSITVKAAELILPHLLHKRYINNPYFFYYRAGIKRISEDCIIANACENVGVPIFHNPTCEFLDPLIKRRGYIVC